MFTLELLMVADEIFVDAAVVIVVVEAPAVVSTDVLLALLVVTLLTFCFYKLLC